MSFSDFYKEFSQKNSWQELKDQILQKTSADVEFALVKKSKRNIEDFKALVSPSAANYLEQMAQLSQQITQKRFGKTIQLYVPMYLSNLCHNICTYCGFRYDNKIPRTILNDQQIINEAKAIKELGFDHILLLTGEAKNTAGIDYLKNALKLIKPLYSHVSMEVQPLEENEYRELIELGLDAVLVYQETYHFEDYRKHHPRGQKAHFWYRLETPDRLGRAGIRKIGLGALIGLEDWRVDSLYCALHLDYLEKLYWKTKFSVSFPRLRPAQGLIEPKVNMSDREFVQLLCAYRIFNENLELSLSTRESAKFRNSLLPLGITSMSAGSKTNPGGYQVDKESLEQFEISDERSASEVATVINNQGYQAVWKDWDANFDQN